MVSIARNFLTRPPTGTPRRAISPGEGLQPTSPIGKGVTKAALYCAHRTSTVSSCAFCEQGGHLATPFPILLKPRVARAGEHSRPLASNHTVKYCFTCSALNSVLLPDTTTAPLAITTYFSARRAAKLNAFSQLIKTGILAACPRI